LGHYLKQKQTYFANLQQIVQKSKQVHLPQNKIKKKKKNKSKKKVHHTQMGQTQH
jgi:hypothetical protein